MKILAIVLSLSLYAAQDTPLQRLMKGNDRYVNNTPNPREDSPKIRQSTTSKQTPFAIVVGCSDSRVPPELVFDQNLGDLFVVRVAGNVVGPIEMETVVFALDNLKTPLIVVLGHESCGAVKAILEGQALEDDVADIAPLILPAIRESKDLPGDPLVNAIEANVRNVIDVLKDNPKVKPYLKSGKLTIVGGYYHLDSGTVELL